MRIKKPFFPGLISRILTLCGSPLAGVPVPFETRQALRMPDRNWIDISVPVFRVNPKLKKKRDCFPGVEFFNDPPWEEWIFRMITQWFLMCVCEITSPVSCGQDLFPDPVFMLQKDDARAVRRRCHSAIIPAAPPPITATFLIALPSFIFYAQSFRLLCFYNSSRILSIETTPASIMP